MEEKAPIAPNHVSCVLARAERDRVSIGRLSGKCGGWTRRCYVVRRVVLRRVLIVASLAALLAEPALGQSRTVLMPGVTYTREVEFTSHGPVVLHVIRAPRPTGLYALKPILSNGVVLGREQVTQMQRRVSSTATVAGVNGGTPSGL
jgi:hypothetical protein